MLAINSIPSKKLERLEQTKERFSNFATLYAKSDYLKELDNLMKQVDKEKEKDTKIE